VVGLRVVGDAQHLLTSAIAAAHQTRDARVNPLGVD
jgi:hypothetical protein